MKIIGDLVIFRSAEPYYSREESGAKPNTERLMTTEEVEWLLKHDPNVTDIRIEYFEGADKFFERELTDISIVSELLGYKLAVLSWKHEGVIEIRKNVPGITSHVRGERVERAFYPKRKKQ